MFDIFLFGMFLGYVVGVMYAQTGRCKYRHLMDSCLMEEGDNDDGTQERNV